MRFSHTLSKCPMCRSHSLYICRSVSHSLSICAIFTPLYSVCLLSLALSLTLCSYAFSSHLLTLFAFLYSVSVYDAGGKTAGTCVIDLWTSQPSDGTSFSTPTQPFIFASSLCVLDELTFVLLHSVAHLQIVQYL